MRSYPPNPLKTALWWLLFLLASCKVNYSFTGADIPPGAETISVEQFRNNSGMGPATLGQTFTEDLRDIFLTQTKLDLVEQNGDLRYSGSITEYEIEPIGVQGDDQASRNRLSIEVRVKYTNTVEKDKSFERKFSRFADFESSQDLSSVEDQLIREINDQLTQDIFDASLSDW